MTRSKSWAHSRGLTGVTGQLWFWIALASVFLILAIWALLNVRAAMVAKRRRQKQEPSDDTEPTGQIPALAQPVDDFEVPDTIRGYLTFGTVLALLLVGGGGTWAALTEIAGAVLASGTVVVDSKVKKVQHPTGGIVGEIHVKDGDTVKLGDLLIRLDDTATNANLQSITKQLDELAVRQARLLSERDGKDEIVFPRSITSRMADATITTITGSERSLFDSRRSARYGLKSQLQERIAQLAAETDGLNSQIAAKAEQSQLANDELSRLTPLETARLVASSKMTITRRDVSVLKGEHAQLLSALAQTKEKIAEIKLQSLQIDQDLRNEVGKELRETQGKEAELIERKITAEDQLRRVELRAPQGGIVHQLTAHTIGGVIGPGEPVMLIVPEGDPLVIEARISPADIDHVSTNQQAFVRFPAFNQRTTPEFNGYVTVISADLTRDPGQVQQGPPYFLARIVLPAEELAGLGSLKLVPGMPAEVHIATPSRTALSYIVKPLTDQIALAFKER